MKSKFMFFTFVLMLTCTCSADAFELLPSWGTFKTTIGQENINIFEEFRFNGNKVPGREYTVNAKSISSGIDYTITLFSLADAVSFGFSPGVYIVSSGEPVPSADQVFRDPGGSEHEKSQGVAVFSLPLFAVINIGATADLDFEFPVGLGIGIGRMYNYAVEYELSYDMPAAYFEAGWLVNRKNNIDIIVFARYLTSLQDFKPEPNVAVSHSNFSLGFAITWHRGEEDDD